MVPVPTTYTVQPGIERCFNGTEFGYPPPPPVPSNDSDIPIDPVLLRQPSFNAHISSSSWAPQRQPPPLQPIPNAAQRPANKNNCPNSDSSSSEGDEAEGNQNSEPGRVSGDDRTSSGEKLEQFFPLS